MNAVHALRFLSLALVATGAIATLPACAASVEDEESAESSDELAGGPATRLYYDGPLPMLEDAKIVVALRGHTVRVSGFAPKDKQLSAADLADLVVAGK